MAFEGFNGPAFAETADARLLWPPVFNAHATTEALIPLAAVAHLASQSVAELLLEATTALVFVPGTLLSIVTFSEWAAFLGKLALAIFAAPFHAKSARPFTLAQALALARVPARHGACRAIFVRWAPILSVARAVGVVPELAVRAFIRFRAP